MRTFFLLLLALVCQQTALAFARARQQGGPGMGGALTERATLVHTTSMAGRAVVDEQAVAGVAVDEDVAGLDVRGLEPAFVRATHPLQHGLGELLLVLRQHQLLHSATSSPLVRHRARLGHDLEARRLAWRLRHSTAKKNGTGDETGMECPTAMGKG